MTPEEETRANVAIQTLQSAWEHMSNVAIAARTEAALLQVNLAQAEARVKELEEKYEPKDK